MQLAAAALKHGARGACKACKTSLRVELQDNASPVLTRAKAITPLPVAEPSKSRSRFVLAGVGLLAVLLIGIGIFLVIRPKETEPSTEPVSSAPEQAKKKLSKSEVKAAESSSDDPEEDGEDPTRPILVLDCGGHTASVGKVLYTSSGREIITLSLDKTARIWNALTGETIRVNGGQISL